MWGDTMEMLCRAYQAEVKAIDGEERTVTSTVNTASVDRYKTVIDPSGIDLQAYRKNPVVLWEHGKDPTRGSRPIGRNLWIKQVGGTLQAKTVFGRDDYSRSIFEMYKDGLLSGWSINVLPDPKESAPPTKDEIRARPDLVGCRMVYRKGELAEYSAVAVPGNAETLTILEQRGIWIPEEVRAAYPKKKLDEGYEDLTGDDEEQPEGVEQGDDEEENPGSPDEGSMPVKNGARKKRQREQDKVSEAVAAVAGQTVTPRTLRYIRKRGGKWVVYSHKGKVLGTHSSRADAVAQLGAIEASKARRGEGRRIELENGVYRVLDGSRDVLSTPDYEVAVECLEAMDQRRSFEQIHSSLLRTIRQEHARIRGDIMAILELSLAGRV